jgi:hypothetical protein
MRRIFDNLGPNDRARFAKTSWVSAHERSSGVIMCAFHCIALVALALHSGLSNVRLAEGVLCAEAACAPGAHHNHSSRRRRQRWRQGAQLELGNQGRSWDCRDGWQLYRRDSAAKRMRFTSRQDTDRAAARIGGRRRCRRAGAVSKSKCGGVQASAKVYRMGCGWVNLCCFHKASTTTESSRIYEMNHSNDHPAPAMLPSASSRQSAPTDGTIAALTMRK